MDDLEYWKTVADKERKRAEANLRLAAERANEIGELRQSLGLAQDAALEVDATNQKLVTESDELRQQLQAAWAEIQRLRAEIMEKNWNEQQQPL